jgi:gluconate kinase
VAVGSPQSQVILVRHSQRLLLKVTSYTHSVLLTGWPKAFHLVTTTVHPGSTGWASKRAFETVNELGYQKVVVSCSTLKEEYRDRFRAMELQGVQVAFIDLQVGKEELVRRMRFRDLHYMKSEMIDSQLSIYGAPSVDKVNVLPVNAKEGVKEIIDQVVDLLKLVGL